jgi:hypothetical protein
MQIPEGLLERIVVEVFCARPRVEVGEAEVHRVRPSASGPDPKVAGQTLVRMMVLDK